METLVAAIHENNWILLRSHALSSTFLCVTFHISPLISLFDQDPHYIFALDVSKQAFQSGAIQSALDSIRCCLVDLYRASQQPCLSHNFFGSRFFCLILFFTTAQDFAYHLALRVKLGIVTYGSSVQFWRLRQAGALLAQPQLLVMADLNDPFLPCPPGDLCVSLFNAQELTALSQGQTDVHASGYHALIACLDLIQSQLTRPDEDDKLAFGAVVSACAECLSETGGKILGVMSSLPSVGCGNLQPREKNELYFSEQEKSLYAPQTQYYVQLGSSLASKRITVDLFVCANAYCDLASLSALCDKSGGQIFHYPGFTSRQDGVTLQHDLTRDVLRPTVYDCLMTIRCSQGLKVVEVLGSFFRRAHLEFEMPTLDCDKSFGVRFEHDGTLTNEACIQVAVLHTHISGQRRIRVHTLSVPLAMNLPDLYRGIDLDSVINLSLKQAVEQLYTNVFYPDQLQQSLVTSCIETLHIYRKFCATSSSAGQLILPESLRLLPLYTLGFIKHPLLADGLPADERCALFNMITSMPCSVSAPLIVPRLFSVLDIQHDQCVYDAQGLVSLPASSLLSSETIRPDGVFLLDNARRLVLWIGAVCFSVVDFLVWLTFCFVTGRPTRCCRGAVRAAPDRVASGLGNRSDPPSPTASRHSSNVSIGSRAHSHLRASTSQAHLPVTSDHRAKWLVFSSIAFSYLIRTLFQLRSRSAASTSRPSSHSLSRMAPSSFAARFALGSEIQRTLSKPSLTMPCPTWTFWLLCIATFKHDSISRFEPQLLLLLKCTQYMVTRFSNRLAHTSSHEQRHEQHHQDDSRRRHCSRVLAVSGGSSACIDDVSRGDAPHLERMLGVVGMTDQRCVDGVIRHRRCIHRH